MVSSTTPRFGPRCPPFLESTVISSWRISPASLLQLFACVSFLTCCGFVHHVQVSAHRFSLRTTSGTGFERRFRPPQFFSSLLNFQFRFFELALANFDQARAFLETREHGSSGNSPLSISSTIFSSFFTASSKASDSLDCGAALFALLGTTKEPRRKTPVRLVRMWRARAEPGILRTRRCSHDSEPKTRLIAVP